MEITHRESEVVNFRDAGADFRWIDIKVFDIVGPGSAREALPAVLGSVWYDDDFASPSGALPDPSRGIHGPYSLAQIGVGSFEKVSARVVRDTLREWAGQLGPLPDEFVTRYENAVAGVLHDSSTIYRLLDLGESARHQWDAHIGQYGFHEFVVVSSRSKTVTVLVASDD